MFLGNVDRTFFGSNHHAVTKIYHVTMNNLDGPVYLTLADCFELFVLFGRYAMFI
jgi:hypothetical protein